MCFCAEVFFCSHTVLPPRSIVWGLFFPSLSSCLCCKFLKQTPAFHCWLYLVWLCMWQINTYYYYYYYKPGTYARILFVDFSSAFNTIIPDTLQNKLTQLSVPTSICQWITSFLTDRQQLVRLGKCSSNTCTISTGAPQGCVLSPLLFSLYTNDCTSKNPSVKLLKFADDTTLIGLIQDGDESAYRQEVKELAVWCSLNNLELNTLKTVEMIVDFRRNPPALPPLTIMNNTVTAVESFRFLGTTISQDLKWDTHIDSIVKKAQQRMYFLRTSFFVLPNEKVQPATGAHDTVLLCCYWVGSVLFYNCMVWVSQQIRYKKTAADC